jgi:hypothetical protein
VKFSLADLLWLLAYAAVLAGVIGALVKVRRDVTAVYGTQGAQTEWDQWRADATEMADGAGPVKRRAPKSAEPPALVLMRDHFAACLGLSLLLSTVLFGTFMFFLRGALKSDHASVKRRVSTRGEI